MSRSRTLTSRMSPSQTSHSRLNQLISFFEVLFCIYSFLFYTGFWWAIVGEKIPLLISLIRYSILMVSLVFLLLRMKTLASILPKGGFLWFFFGICILSIFWSINPALTFKGIVQALLQISIFGLYFSSRFNPKHQLYVIAAAMSITVVANLFYVVALPSLGRHVGDKFDGAWKGFYANKNEFSGIMLWSLIVFYILSFKDSNRVAMSLARAGLFLCPILVILSTSKTALVVFIFLYCALTIWHKYYWQGSKTILIFDLSLLSLLMVVSAISNNWATLVAGLGKDPTMSGRTDIWAATAVQINQRPLLGHGYHAFWSESNPMARSIGDSLSSGFYTYNSHNGFLDILLDLGWLGMLLFMIGFFSTWALALRYAYRAKSPEDSWPLAVMLLVTSYNLTESSFMTDNINWLFYVLAYLSMRIWPRRLSQQEPVS
jgi:exopolysaccharide production protein ExoQ